MPYYLEDEDLMPLEGEEELPRPGMPKQEIPASLRRILTQNGTRPPGEAFEVQTAADKADAYAKQYGQRPEQPKAKWWQKAIATGLGAAAGVSNAEGRGKPVDVSGAAGEILAPGYRRKLSDWAAKTEQAGVERDVANANRDAWWKNRKNEADISASEANAEQARQHGAYWENRSEMEQNQWKVNARGQLYNTVTGEIKNPAPTLQERYDEAKRAGFSDDEAKVYATGGKLGEPKPGKNPTNPQEVLLNPDQFTPAQVAEAKRQFSEMHRPPRGDGEVRRMTPGQKSMIERRKNDALAKGEAQAKLRVKGDPVKGIEPEDPNTVYAEWKQEKQAIQNAYEGEIAAATGGDPGHFEYPEPAPKPKPAAPPAPSSGGRGPKPAAKPTSTQAPQEGTIIRHPQTGERRILRNGQWQPL